MSSAKEKRMKTRTQPQGAATPKRILTGASGAVAYAACEVLERRGSDVEPERQPDLIRRLTWRKRK